jgi:apolipoprotein N-acyltransferase
MIYLLFAITSGLLTGLSFDFQFLNFLAWFSLTPFLFILKDSSLKKGIFYSFIFGFIYSLTAMFWVGNVTKLGLIILLFYLALYAVLFFIAGRYFLKKPLAIITIPCVWVILEFLRENIWCGFGWTNLGYSQYNNLYLIQPADLFGVKGISFIIVMVNVFFLEIFLRKRFLFYKFLTVLIVLSSIWGYAFFRLNNLEHKSSVNLSVVQPNIPQELKWEEAAQGDIIEKLKKLSLQTSRGSLVIFPEAAWPLVVGESNYNLLRDFVKEVKRNTLIGVITSENENFYNTAFVFDKEAEFLGIYRKIKLVPFGEYIPLRDLFSFIDVINSIGDTSRGKEYKIFSYNDKKFAVLICFEDIFPLFVSDFAKRSDFLVNITNDAWYGGNPECNQHLSMIVMRAVENRISIARCANTGISGWVSYKGQVHKLKYEDKDILIDGTLDFNLPLNTERTLYNKWGEAFIYLCILFLALCVLVRKKNHE